MRIDFYNASPSAVAPLRTLEGYLHDCSVDRKLLHLVKMRASQINGCAYCLDMHSKDLRAEGDSEQRLYLLNAWREASVYSARERAALGWTEAVTLLADGHVEDDVYATAREHFSEKELVDLTMALVAINGWNRLCVSFRTPAGTYRPAEAKAD